MKGGIATCLTAGLLMSAAGASAQQTFVWPAPVSSQDVARMAYFPLGTPINLVTRTQVSTKENKPGDRFYLEVTEPVSYRGQVVIPTGSIAVGEIANLQRNGHFGKKGKIDVRLVYVETPSGPIRLTGRADDEGTSGTITSIATIAIVSPLGFLVHGTSANLPAGSVVKGYLAENMRFAVQPAQAQIAVAQAVPDEARAMATRAGLPSPGFSNAAAYFPTGN